MAAAPLLLKDLFRDEKECEEFLGSLMEPTPYSPVTNKMLEDALRTCNFPLINLLIKSGRERGIPSFEGEDISQFMQTLMTGYFDQAIPQVREAIAKVLEVEPLRRDIRISDPLRTVSILRYVLDRNPGLIATLSNKEDFAAIPKTLGVPAQLLLLGIVREFMERTQMDRMGAVALLLQGAEPKYDTPPSAAWESQPLLQSPQFLKNFLKLIELAEKADKERMEQERTAKPRVYVDNYELKAKFDAMELFAAKQAKKVNDLTATVDILTRALNELVPGLAAKLAAAAEAQPTREPLTFAATAPLSPRARAAGERPEEKERKERKDQKRERPDR